MRSLRVVVVNEPREPAANAGRTAIPGRIEPVRPLFERLEPPLGVVAAAVFDVTAHRVGDKSLPLS